MPRTLILATALGALAVVGCSSGSGGDGEMMTPTCISFTPDPAGAAEPGTARAVMGSGSSCNEVVVEMQVTDVDGVFGAGFNVTYDSGVAEFLGTDPTPTNPTTHLRSDGATVATLPPGDDTGGFSFGIARQGVATGIDFSGTQTLARLRFRLRSGNAAGSTGLLVQNGHLDDSQTPPQPIGGVTFFGGTLDVQ